MGLGGRNEKFQLQSFAVVSSTETLGFFCKVLAVILQLFRFLAKIPLNFSHLGIWSLPCPESWHHPGTISGRLLREVLMEMGEGLKSSSIL